MATKCTPIPAVTEDGWTAWHAPVMTGYKMGCCDCGLVHEVEFQALKIINKEPDGTWTADELDQVEYRVQMRMRREVE